MLVRRAHAEQLSGEPTAAIRLEVDCDGLLSGVVTFHYLKSPARAPDAGRYLAEQYYVEYSRVRPLSGLGDMQ